MNKESVQFRFANPAFTEMFNKTTNPMYQTSHVAAIDLLFQPLQLNTQCLFYIGSFVPIFT